MEPVDGQDVNLLNYFKDNKIPHTWECARCGAWYGQEPYKDSSCQHNWVVRDLRPFQNAQSVQKDVNENETSNRNDSI